jgi:fucose permease
VKNKVTLLGALFIFAYQGAEVSISGWIVSYLINYRDGDPAHVGYVSSGFWAGITFGRFVLTYPARRVGEKLAVLVLTAGAIAFQLLAWFIPNIIGQAVAVAIIGLILGPAYPCAALVFSRLLPRNIQTTSLSFVSAMGSSGGAVAPFVTGLLAQHLGTVVLHPICLGLYGVMVVSWSCLPRIVKRSE